MILTLDYLKTEATAISSYWNGGDEHFVDGNGDLRTDEDAQTAEEIIKLCTDLEQLYELIK